jgi:PAS domain S-box-containing protein
MLASPRDQSDAIVLNADIALVEIRNRHIVWANASMHRMFGYEPDEMFGKPTRQFFGDFSSYEHFGRELDYALSTSGRHSCISPLLRKDGSMGWFEVRVEDDHGRLVVGVLDRSASRDLVSQLVKVDERYRSVVEDLTEVISRIRPDGTILFVNDVYCRLFGKTTAEIIGNKWQPVAHPDDLPLIEARLREMRPDNPVVVIENRVYMAGGELRWMQFVNRGVFEADGRLSEIQSVGRDITRLKLVEAELRESQAMLERAQAVARIGSFSFGGDAEDFSITPEAARLFDVGDCRKLTREQWLARVHPDDRAAVIDAWNAGLRGSAFQVCHRIDATSQVTWVETIAEFRFDTHGSLLGGVGTVQDITGQRRVETALRESEERARHAMEAARAGSWEFDPGTGEFLADQRALEIHGIAAGTSMSLDQSMDHVYPPDRERVAAAVRSCLESGEDLRLEHRVEHPDGGLLWVEAHAQRKRGSDGSFTLAGFVRDITDRKTAEERLAESKRQLDIALWGANVGIWDTDIATRRCTFDARFYAMLGREPAEIDPSMDGWFALIHPEDLPIVHEAIRAHDAGDTAVFEVEHRLRHKNGHWTDQSRCRRTSRACIGHPRGHQRPQARHDRRHGPAATDPAADHGTGCARIRTRASAVGRAG